MDILPISCFALSIVGGILYRRQQQFSENQSQIAIIVHGGAYAIPDSSTYACEMGCRNAAQAGYKVLSNGGSAAEAVEAAVNVLENDPAFDAGYGSVLTAEGVVEMDAVIMDGETLDAGAVAGVTSVRNPITLARHIMKQTKHVLLIGSGADKFARKIGLEEVSTKDLVTQAAIDELSQFRKYSDTVGGLFNTTATAAASGHDTVGCVCIDRKGTIAGGTSTGGITAKMQGRVGDSPIIGSGLYADSKKGGVSTTGHGESIMKMCLAKSGVDLLMMPSNKNNPTRACELALQEMLSRVEGRGGMIAVSPRGVLGHACTTPRMCWASVESSFNIDCATSCYSGLEPRDKNIWTID